MTRRYGVSLTPWQRWRIVYRYQRGDVLGAQRLINQYIERSINYRRRWMRR